MNREEAKKIIEDFIKNQLKQNKDDKYDNAKYIELSTETNAYFIIYKKNRESSIYVKPKNGQKNFSESIDRILDYYIDNKTEHHADKSYVVPISDYIFKNMNTLNLNNENVTQLNKIYSEAIKMKTKNIMLYGAPGVGKTHNYKRLITMIEDGNDEKTIFDTISKNETTNDFDNLTFETIKNEKRIEFVTFHQSYSYEDFIEGFRPQDNGNIKLEDGIFKKLCDEAKDNLEDTKLTLKEFNEKYNLLRDFKIYAENRVKEQETIKFGNFEFRFNKFDKDILYFTLIENDKYFLDSFITFDMIKKYFNQTLNNIYDDNKAFICVDFKMYMKKLNLIMPYSKEYEGTRNVKNFYIVIDEINRGNISKIFGELITLIEEDKRDTYEVTLPYSKEKFKIPSNLYIIATMNSTDKSIATIDIALRRRFTFLKMKPNLDLVPEIAKKLFEKINDHISKTINKDYKLGHSYFMKIENEDDLEFVKKYKIQPLLEEYFYGDEKNFDEAIEILNKKEDKQ